MQTGQAASGIEAVRAWIIGFLTELGNLSPALVRDDRGGVTRSSDELPVMGTERRGCSAYVLDKVNCEG